MLLAPYLEDSEEALGGAVLVKHLKPVGINTHIRIICILVRVRGNKVYTRLEVYAKNRKIGEGSHIQVVMSRSRFARLLREARQRSKHGQG